VKKNCQKLTKPDFCLFTVPLLFFSFPRSPYPYYIGKAPGTLPVASVLNIWCFPLLTSVSAFSPLFFLFLHRSAKPIQNEKQHAQPRPEPPKPSKPAEGAATASTSGAPARPKSPATTNRIPKQAPRADVRGEHKDSHRERENIEAVIDVPLPSVDNESWSLNVRMLKVTLFFFFVWFDSCCLE
jgi:hypothetical protein